ncbi:phage regulatory CII family protein [Delftia sp. PS-11]|uniref:phage regulatory CII family protein n=1 Tax=Delftia sp. PS-11 TaxID=2767222 RepID=UPI0024566A08|nr:phage regulatory CII family protein [Delftia sp. PS-11]KAJ8743665.1 transcriptional regulator [Delftia sp. PS-11]
MMWLDALRTAVNQYPGGRTAIAARLNKSDEVLRKELAGTSSTHKLGLSDSQQIVEMLAEAGVDCTSFRVAVDAACLVVHPMVEQCLHALAADGTREAADLAVGICESLSDRHYSDNDLRKGRRAVFDVIRKMAILLAAMNARHAADNARGQA